MNSTVIAIVTIVAVLLAGVGGAIGSHHGAHMGPVLSSPAYLYSLVRGAALGTTIITARGEPGARNARDGVSSDLLLASEQLDDQQSPLTGGDLFGEDSGYPFNPIQDYWHVVDDSPLLGSASDGLA